MAITIIATPGAEDANSYVTVAEASAYLEAVLSFSSVWSGYTTDQKNARLVAAGRAIDRMSFLGSRYDSAQAMEFPRTSQLVDVVNPVVDIPKKVKDAQCEMVIYQGQSADATTGQINEDAITDFALSGVMSVSFAQAADSAGRNAIAGGNADAVKALLREWLSGGEHSWVMLK